MNSRLIRRSCLILILSFSLTLLSSGKQISPPARTFGLAGSRIQGDRFTSSVFGPMTGNLAPA